MLDNQGEVVSILSDMALFKGLKPYQVNELLPLFDSAALGEGEYLFRQGDPGNSFYIILEGKIALLRVENKKERIVGWVGRCDYLGHECLLHNQRHSISARVEEPVQILRLSREYFLKLLGLYPEIKLYLAQTMQTQRLTRHQRYAWLSNDETVYLMARKHLAYLLVSLIPVVGLGWLAIPFLYFSYQVESNSLRVLLEWIGGGLLVVAGLWGVWKWLDWGNDYYIVTNQRVIWIERIIGIYESRQEAPHSTILTVVVRTDQIGRLLGYGNVVIRTYTGQIVLHNVGLPNQLAGLIEEMLGRMRVVVKKNEEKAMEQAIRERLNPPPKKEVPLPPPVPKPQKRSNPFNRFFKNFLRLRYEEAGVVTFRKHWLLLFYKVWQPSLGILLLTIASVLRVMGVYDWFSVATLLTLSIGIILVLLLVWVYQYLDWRNDIYQVTSDQIVDVYKKPLGAEDKKTANLENILSVEHSKQGLIGILFNYGDVVAMVGAAKFTFDGVFNPAGVQQEIFNAINRRKQAVKETEARRERERSADWLAAYYRETHRSGGPGSSGA